MSGHEEVRARISERQRWVEETLRTDALGVNRLTIVKAPPGSGKTYTLLLTAAAAFEARLRVAIAAQTNAQADDICRRIARDYPAVSAVRFAGGGSARVNLGPNILWTSNKDDLPSGRSIVVATTAKWGMIQLATPFDLLMVDEAWQMSWANFMLCGQVSSRFILIGDPGQIPPVVSIATSRWETSERPPHFPAPEVILNDDELREVARVLTLPASRRLPYDSVGLLQSFYDFPFDSWAGPGERAVLSNPGGNSDLDRTIDLLTTGSVAILAVPTPEGGPPMEHDLPLAEQAASLVQRLLDRGARIRENGSERPIQPEDIGLAATHRVMNTALSLALPVELQGRVVVDTPERWQGLERPIMLAVHPLSGVVRPSTFDLETGRLCVMASRHRGGLVLLTRDHVPETLGNTIPSADQPPGRPDIAGRGHKLHAELWYSLQQDGRIVGNPRKIGPPAPSQVSGDGDPEAQSEEETLPARVNTADEPLTPAIPDPPVAPLQVPPTPIVLSDAQRHVVEHRGGHLQVIACAGSGKTESISRRISALIAEGAEPASIVAFTFTEKAAGELKERVYRRVEEAMGRDFLGRLGPMFVGTIHGYCFRLLQDQIPEYGNFDVLEPHRHAAFLSRMHRRLALSRLGTGHWSTIQGITEIVDIVGNELISTETLPDGIREVYADYCAALDRFHYLTFGQIIQKAVEELENPEMFARIHAPLRHLVVDEYQDINPAQHRLIQLLGRDPVHVCVVGDDDQSIYQWRGSDTSHILEFADRWPGVTSVELTTNRRSVPRIIRAADDFARTIQPRIEKAMEASREDQGPALIPWSAETPEQEARRVSAQIRRLREQGFRYRDIAVLYRSVRTSSPLLLEALREDGIPFACGGRTGLFIQPEVNVLGRTYAWLVDNEWRDQRFGGDAQQITAERLLVSYETAFADGATIPGLGNFLRDWKRAASTTNRPANLVEDYYRLLRLLGVHGLDVDDPEQSARMGALARFSTLLADFENVTRRARWVCSDDGSEAWRGGTDRGIWYYRRLANYLQHYAKDAYEDFEGETFADLDAVNVLTIHQAKGLEWPVVFLPALTARRFPTSRAGRPRDWLLPEDVFPPAARSRYEGGDTEERRLFYVALTRARDCVYLSWFERITQRQRPSPYLTDLLGPDLPQNEDPLPLPPEPATDILQDAPPTQVSFSDVAQYEGCPFQYRLANSLGFENMLVPELGYGRAIHHVLRVIAEQSRETGEVPSPEQIRAILRREFYLPFANPWAFEAMSQAADRLVDRYLDRWVDDLRRIWATERPFEIHTEDGILTGRADVILDRHEGDPDSLAIVDYKSSTDADRDDVFAFQLAIYAAAGRGEGLNVRAAFLHDLQLGNRDEKDVDSSASAAAVERAGALIRGIRQADFPHRSEEQKCKQCDYRRLCRHAECDAMDLL